MNARYNHFGRRSEVREIRIPRPRSKPQTGPTFDKGEKAEEIYSATTRKVRSLVKNKGALAYWRKQVETAFDNSPAVGEERDIETLAANCLVLARVHDRYGGLPKIITPDLWGKRPEGYRVRCGSARCEVYLENVMVDLEERGLLLPQKQERPKADEKADADAPQGPDRKKSPSIRKQRAEETEALDGIWSSVMAKSQMMAVLRMNSLYKFNQFAARHSIRMIDNNRQNFKIRLDTMADKDRKKFETA